MGINIVSGATSDVLTVDITSKAARSTLYRSDGIEILHRPAYSATISGWTIPATPTDMVTLTGSASKTINVTRIRITGNQTTAGINIYSLIKRTSADSGGTFVNDSANITKHDTNDPAVTATFGHYTANPASLGTAAGTPRITRMLCPAPAGTTNDNILWDFDDLGAKPLILRGATEQLAINFAGAALPVGMVLSVMMEWTEV